MIEIRVRCRLGAATVDADLETSATALALVGPSGGGKTTLLNMIAGLLTPDEGRIVIGHRVLFDSAAGVNLPPRQRGLGYVFQEPRLFPHYSVARNLRYGARAGRGRAPIVGFEQVVARLGIGGLLDRRPAGLSGGEKQRVAIGRALLSAPRALLLDEPLSALDAARREELLALMASLREQVPMILVSHRLDEVERLAGASAVVEPGRRVRLQG